MAFKSEAQDSDFEFMTQFQTAAIKQNFSIISYLAVALWI